MTKIVTNSITIDAPAAAVWDALVNPIKTRQYMFGCEPITDWQPGSSLLWKGVFDGQELIAVKGEIVKIEPPKYLEYTVIDPNGTIPDVPENYLTVTYTLTEKNGQTEFTTTQGDYSKVAEGERRYQDTIAEGGWGGILEQIKKLVESI
jgi:uncharacterized protein YndB with AHSA1/START domain